MLSSGHSVAVTLMSSLQLWEPTNAQADKLSQHSSRQHQLDSTSCLKKKVMKVGERYVERWGERREKTWGEYDQDTLCTCKRLPKNT